MGCSYSCCIEQSQSELIRIVRLNGSVEEINYPITVAELTARKEFVFTQAGLLAAATPLRLEAPLERGRVYFLLPSALFESSVSPLELAPIARKLASIALNAKPKPQSAHEPFKCAKSKSWKPILPTIRERSFNRRSESDLHAQED